MAPTSTFAARPTTSAPPSTLAANAAGSTTLATTSTSSPEPPTTLAPTTSTTLDAPTPLVSAVPGNDGREGQWEVAASLAGRPVLWITHWHPFADRPKVWASAALFDQTRLSAAHYNGTRLPGNGRWRNVGTIQEAVKPWVVAVFNGGFLLQHITGGYFSEGRTVKRLQEGQATLGVRISDRRLVLGVYGREVTNDGSWRSLRQNLPPMIDNGRVTVREIRAYWGKDQGGIADVPRSGICNMPDGRMMYVSMGLVDIGPFADAVAATGCVLGMELDVNGTWPFFQTFTNFGTPDRKGVTLDPAHMKDPNRVFRASWHDFFALFDPANLPSDAIA